MISICYKKVAELYMSGEYTMKQIGLLLNITESRICQMIAQQRKWGWYSKFSDKKSR